MLHGLKGGSQGEAPWNGREWRRAGKGWILRLKMYDKPVCDMRIRAVNLTDVKWPGKSKCQANSFFVEG